MRTIAAFLIVTCLAPSVALAAPAKATLTWVDNADNELGVSVERKAEACAGTAIAFAEMTVVAANATTFVDTSAQEGKTYCYRVAASNSAGKSDYSNTAEITVPFTRPATPTALTVK